MQLSETERFRFESNDPARKFANLLASPEKLHSHPNGESDGNTKDGQYDDDGDRVIHNCLIRIGNAALLGELCVFPMKWSK